MPEEKLQKQIDDLKRRIKILEQRPIYYPVYPIQPQTPTPQYPSQPYWNVPPSTC
jgi:hypothetical protein